MKGYGKLLKVNISMGNFAIETLDTADIKKFVGGRGLGIRYLYFELRPGVDPLGKNKLLFLREY
uniref:Aldehyde ferredoxin oxidoreductase N-terminal domain-containing protein n=1 Tax=candidate division WOR-3 bacterium TaxID=2052148 RepID=A0A7C2PD82_UNCW3